MIATCIIVDDEPISRDILRKYIKDIPGLQLAAECGDAFEASALLADKKVDIIFLDINMPRLSGISFARSLKNSPMIIFTTAYPNYAVEGFDLDAIDYLVKPFSLERFMRAVNKAFESLKSSENKENPEVTILVRSDKKIYALKPMEIAYVEACGDYIKIILTDNQTLIVHETMKRFVSTLPENCFMRIHKSYAINLSHVEFIDGNQLHITQKSLPISTSLRQELLERLK